MIKEFIGNGKTIEEATAAAKAGLNAPLTADVKIEIIAMPKKKVLGLFGGSDAQVKASYDDGRRERKPRAPKNDRQGDRRQQKNAPAPKTERPSRQEYARDNRDNRYDNRRDSERRYEHKPERTEPYGERPVITEDDVDLEYACTYLKTIIEGLEISDPVVTAKIVDGGVEMSVECDDYGIIIGRRGDTLDAIQYLTSLALKNRAQKYCRVTINVCNYREKRAQSLEGLARRQADYVLRTGRRHFFEPMNPYERRIIHMTISEIDGVVSRSIGMGDSRKVVIEPENRRSDYNNSGRRGGSGRRPRAQTAQPDPNREKKVDRADMPKFGKIDINK